MCRRQFGSERLVSATSAREVQTGTAKTGSGWRTAAASRLANRVWNLGETSI